jgi:hypothetical protein
MALEASIRAAMETEVGVTEAARLLISFDVVVGLQRSDSTMGMLSSLTSLALVSIPACTLAAETAPQASESAGHVGVSGLWVLANICFAGMRAQNSPSTGWRIVAFIVGFPGTLITYFVVDEGSERAYGIEIPKKR